MKKRNVPGLLLILGLILSGLAGIRSDAATVRASSYLSPYNNGWEHDEKSLMNDWHYQSGSRQMIFTYYVDNSAPVQAVYCIAPTNARKTGDVLSEFSEAYISSHVWNQTISGAEVKELLSYILYFGYAGQISETDSRTGNLTMTDEVLAAFDKALATQILVWEAVVGERGADFSKRSTGGADSCLSIVKSTMPGYSEYFLPEYNYIADSVTQMLKIPSFLSAEPASSLRSKLEWDGTKYSLTLTDTNDCLSGWSFSGDGLSFSVSGNRLSITAASLPDSEDIPITAVRQITGRSMTIQTSSASYDILQTQPTAVPGTTVTSRKTAYLKVYGDASGELRVSKVSARPALTDGSSCYTMAGIRFAAYTSENAAEPARDMNGQEAVFTLDAGGNAPAVRLPAGRYYIRELSVVSGCGYRPDPSDVRIVSVTGGSSSAVTFSDEPLDDPAGVVIRKTDENGLTPAGADMSGARYELCFYAGQYEKSSLPAAADAVWVIVTKNKGGLFLAQLSDEYIVSGDGARYGKSADGAYVLPLGTLTIREIQAPPGFTVSGSTMQLAAGDGSDAAEGLMLVHIVDRNSAVFVRSGNQTADASEGFEILQKERSLPVSARLLKTNDEGAPLAAAVFNLRYPEADGVLRDHTAVSDAEGLVCWDGIPYGTEALLSEVSAPEGYRPDPAAAAGIRVSLTGTLDASGEFYVFDLGTFINSPQGGRVTVRKTSEGNTPAGFRFRLSGTSFLGEAIEKSAVTGADGTADFGFVPRGSYTLSEADLPAYMTAEPASRTVEVADADVSVSFANRLKTGSIRLKKTLELPDGLEPDGSAPAGFRFLLSGTSEAGTPVEREAVTDASGQALFPDVPYGTYLLTEALTEEQRTVWTAPEAFSVTVGEETPELFFRIVNRLRSVPLKVIKSSDDSVSEGFRFTIRGTMSAGGAFERSAVTDAEGIADLGEVPFGSYEVTEAEDPAYRCDGPWSFMLTPETEAPFIIRAQNSRVRIETRVTDAETGCGLSEAGGSVQLTDTVYCFHLTPAAVYRLHGTLMDAESGLPFADAGGEPVELSCEFTAESGDTAFDMVFRFSAEGLGGRKLVVFEELYRDGVLIAEHKDLQDDAQTVYLPQILTRAADALTGSDHIKAGSSVSLCDTVSYRALRPGLEYRLKGTLTDKKTGEPLLLNGSPLCAELCFTPEKPDGTLELVFSFDASALAGVSAVVFEKLLLGELEIAAHEDLQDAAQTVYLPGIRTEAALGDVPAPDGQEAEAIRIVDTVYYEGLEAGRTYTLRGLLTDKAGGEALSVNGAPVTAELLFTPESGAGSTELFFSAPAALLRGKTLVVFESLYLDGLEVAVHADLEDAAQTVSVPLPPPPETTPEPETTVPETTPEPETTTVPETTPEPETTVPETTLPETSPEPETTVPETTPEPETTTVPETTALPPETSPVPGPTVPRQDHPEAGEADTLLIHALLFCAALAGSALLLSGKRKDWKEK